MDLLSTIAAGFDETETDKPKVVERDEVNAKGSPRRRAMILSAKMHVNPNYGSGLRNRSQLATSAPLAIRISVGGSRTMPTVKDPVPVEDILGERGDCPPS